MLTQLARSLLILVLCGEGRLKAHQKEAYGEISLFINEKYDSSKQFQPNIHNLSPMESDDNQF